MVVIRMFPLSKWRVLIMAAVLCTSSSTIISARRHGSCVAKPNPTLNSIIWPNGKRPIWNDPGPENCSMPSGIDAGLCVRVHTLRTTGEGGSVRCLPSFIIIGVQKAGTRELRNWLDIHPNLTGHSAELGYLNRLGCTTESFRRAKQKETKSEVTSVCDAKGDDVATPPRSDFTYFWRGYLDRFPAQKAASRHTQYSFEKTPEYIKMTQSRIFRLRKVMPSLRFLLIVREPVSRTYSWYNMACMAINDTKKETPGARGFAEILDGPYTGEIWAIRGKVEKFLGLTEPRTKPKYKWKPLGCSATIFDRYILQALNTTNKEVPILQRSGTVDRASASGPLERGQYASQLAKWMQVYPKAQFHVVTMNELLQDSAKTMAEIESFLGIPHFPYSKHFGVSRTGSTVLLGSHSKIDRPYKTSIEPMTQSTADLLQKYYEPYHTKLQDILERDIVYG